MRAPHPLAWWAWALALAAALSRTVAPIAVAAIAAALVIVVLSCRGQDRWGRAFGGYLILAGSVVVIRVIFQVLVGPDGSGAVLVDLPRWSFAGLDLLGPIRTNALVSAVAGGLALGALLLCFGAANSLADPVRALRSLPAALHPIGTAVVVAVTVAPRLVSSVARVRRAQRLRGITARGWRGLRATAVPVLADALDHALALAASMQARGYARSTGTHATWAVLVALAAAVLGTYGLLDAQAPPWLGLPMLGVAVMAGMVAVLVAGRASRRTRYRPQRWQVRDVFIAGCGVLAAVIVLLAAPGSPVLGAVLGAAIAALPAIAGASR